MSDLPDFILQQQSHARPMSGEDLETLGKKAASCFQCEELSLNEAVVETVKHAGLSPEQVRRVVEFTNTHAYLNEFNKEGSDHKVIEFPGGPANPSEILKDLNDGGGGSVADTGMGDYSKPPDVVMKRASAEPELEKAAEAKPKTLEEYLTSGSEPAPVEVDKTASSQGDYETQLFNQFVPDSQTVYPHVNPAQPLIELKEKLGAAQDQLNSELTGLEIDYAEAGERVYQQVKQAAMAGTSLVDVVHAWSTVAPSPEYVKVAFGLLTPRLRKDEVFETWESIGESLAKTAADNRAVNPKHPLVEEFDFFCQTLGKMASLRQLKAEVIEGLGQTNALLKQAFQLGGALGKAWRGVGEAGRVAGEKVAPIAGKLVKDAPMSAQQAKAIGDVTKRVAQLGAAGTAGGVGLAGVQSVTDRPMAQRAMGAYKSIIPGTQEYQIRRARTRMGM